MTIFDLILIASFLATVVVLVLVLIAAIRGRWSMLRNLLIGWGVFAAVYFGALVAISLATPQRLMSVGENRCWDDWCIAVTKVQRATITEGALLTVTLRMSSSAKRVTQRENGLSVYLIDDRGRRYEPVPAASAKPFDVPLGPGDSAEAERVFQVPADSHGIGLGFAHAGPGRFIIGDDGSFLHKPTIVRIE
jgi:hypothetical protein